MLSYRNSDLAGSSPTVYRVAGRPRFEMLTVTFPLFAEATFARRQVVCADSMHS